MAVNSATLADKDGDYSDWIELYNPGSSAINLQGWSLTDNMASPRKWIFPDFQLAGHSYVVLFASGKDVADPSELHTNFKLDGDGEYLALIDANGTIVSEFAPTFPSQQADVSFAWLDGDYIKTSIPTPGSENQFDAQTTLNPPSFSHERGFYKSPFQVVLSSQIASADIYYTLDGSEPTPKTATLYNAPIPVNTTSVLRAIVSTNDLVSV